MNKFTALVLSGAMLVSTAGPLAATAGAQRYDHNRYSRNYNNGYSRNYNNYYRGARNRQLYDDRYDRNYYESERYHKAHSGIGTGQGALIGGAGGAVLGALFGGGAKGAIIGGAAGAGIGALLGKSAEDNRHEKYGDYGRRY